MPNHSSFRSPLRHVALAVVVATTLACGGSDPAPLSSNGGGAQDSVTTGPGGAAGASGSGGSGGTGGSAGSVDAGDRDVERDGAVPDRADGPSEAARDALSDPIDASS